jgi:hypothetical protein
MPAMGDYDDGELWWNDWRGKPKYSEKTCPSATLSTTNSTSYPDANPGRIGGEPTNNRLSYGMAIFSSWSSLFHPQNGFPVLLEYCLFSFVGSASFGGLKIVRPVQVT